MVYIRKHIPNLPSPGYTFVLYTQNDNNTNNDNNETCNRQATVFWAVPLPTTRAHHTCYRPSFGPCSLPPERLTESKTYKHTHTISHQGWGGGETRCQVIERANTPYTRVGYVCKAIVDSSSTNELTVLTTIIILRAPPPPLAVLPTLPI